MDEDDDDPVPLPNVNGAIMRKVGVLGGRGGRARETETRERGRVALNPGSLLWEKESLVHTVCACVKIPRNPQNSDSSVKLPISFFSMRL